MHEVREEYTRRNDVTFEDTTKIATMLLPKLMSEGQYAEEEKSIFTFCRNFVENFIYREILNLVPPINVSPINVGYVKTEKILQEAICDPVDPVRENLLVRLAVTYVLHEFHNRRLNRCAEELFSLHQKDDYLCDRILSVARKSPNHPERMKYFDSQKSTQIMADEIFDVATRMSLTYISPYSSLKTTWTAPQYAPQKNESFYVTLNIDTVRDKEFTEYHKYIQYLLKEERNTVGDFSSAALWKNSVRARFSKDKSLETLAANEIHLLIFCLSLGFGKEVFDRLIKLRDKAFQGQEIAIKIPPITTREKSVLLQFLENSAERLRCARNETGVKNKNHIVRRVLVNVSLDLMTKFDLLPVVVLSDEEIARSGVDPAFFDKFYDYRNGKRVFKRKTDDPSETDDTDNPDDI